MLVRSFLVALHLDLWLQTGSSSCASIISCSLVSEPGSEDITHRTRNHFVIIDCRLKHLISSLEAQYRIGYDNFYPRKRLISLTWNLFSRILNRWLYGELDPGCDYSHVVPGLCGPFPKRLTSPRCIPMIPRTPLPSLSVCIWFRWLALL